MPLDDAPLLTRRLQIVMVYGSDAGVPALQKFTGAPALPLQQSQHRVNELVEKRRVGLNE